MLKVLPSGQKSSLLGEWILVAGLYAITARLGFLLAIDPGNVTVLWPPSGIAFAAVIICGARMLPAVWIGSFVINSWYLLSHYGVSANGCLAALGIATGSTLQAALGAYLLHKLVGACDILDRPQDALKFLASTAISCLVAATVGVTSLMLSGFIQAEAFRYTWFTWWAGDACGVLVFTTLALTWRTIPDYLRNRERWAELALCLIGMVLIVQMFAFGSWSPFARNHFPFTYMFFPLMLGAAGRFGASGVTLCVLIIEILAIWGTKNGLGPFIRPHLNDSLILLQGFISMVALSGLSLASVLTNWQNSRKKLQSFAEDLEHKIADRTKELEAANRDLMVARDQAIEASEVKSAFVATISHELRTPLSGIIGAVQLLNSEYGSSNTKELLQIVLDSSQSLLKIVNEILDLSKLEVGKVVLEQEPFNVIYVVQDSARMMAVAAKTKGLVLKTSIDHRLPELIRGDAERVRQTLHNLLANAVKFTDSGEVCLDASVAVEEETSVIVKFTVKDTGIGIAESERSKLFEPFTQVDSSDSRKYGGTGLGLSICKRLVELMGGEIGVESEKGKGSLFWFTVPFQRCIDKRPDSSGAIPTPTQDFTALVGRVVLVVEDNKVIRALVSKQLSSMGIKTNEAKDGSEAVAAASERAYDLILMDCQMPIMDGFEATRRIRALETAGKERTPIIALTAGVMPDDDTKCRSAGMDDYLSKPASFADLTAILLRWLPKVPTDSK